MAPGWRTGLSSPRPKVNENTEQNISGAFVPAPTTAAQLDPVLASNQIANLIISAWSWWGPQGREQSKDPVVTSSSPLGWGSCFSLTAELENTTSAPTFSESQLSLLLAHFLELARICPLILANSSRSPRITAVTIVHRFSPRTLRDGMISQ